MTKEVITVRSDMNPNVRRSGQPFDKEPTVKEFTTVLSDMNREGLAKQSLPEVEVVK